MLVCYNVWFCYQITVNKHTIQHCNFIFPRISWTGLYRFATPSSTYTTRTFSTEVSVCTVQTVNSCTSRPGVYQYLVVQTPMDNMSKNSPSKLRRPVMYLAHLFVLSMGVCITKHWQTSGRLVQRRMC